MYSSRSGCNFLTRLFCVVISYSLLVSLSTPFHACGAVPRSGRNTFAAAQGGAARQRGAHREGELLVRFRPDVSRQEIEEIAASKGARRDRRFRGASGIEKLTLPSGHDPEALAAELRMNPAVEFAEPNYLIKRNEIVPDDSRFGEQWALRNTGGAGAHAGADIGATNAWEATTGAASTVIAVIDSGVDFTHPDLRSNQWTNSKESENGQDDDGNDLVDDLHGWDWVSGSNKIKDEQGHGTVIAGIIAAQGNNATGVSGVMWRASLMSLRVLDATGTGDVADAVEAIDYAVAQGARVINCSWGMDEASVALKDAIKRAARRGVLVVCSAGNDGRNVDVAPYYPASFELENLISVASTDNTDQLTTGSNWGAVRIHVGAPGENVLSTKMGGGYRMVSGSSASAPVVAGVAGLVRTLRPYLSAKLTRQMILVGVRPVETLAGKVSSGGIVNAAGSLGALNSLSADEGLNEGDELGEGDENNQNGGNGGNGNGNGGHRPERPVERTKGAPGLNLPNLDEARKSRPPAPRAPSPIRSNLAPGCDPSDPDCNECYGCNPTPTPPPPSSTPIGWLDAVGGDGGAWGWAFDPDAAAQSIDVHFYIDGPASTGQWGGAAAANQPRPDVNQAYGVQGAHGFWFSIPPRFRDGRAHTLYVYGIDVTGNPNALLSGVPKSFTLSAAGSITAGPNPVQVCDGTGLGVTTLSWATSGTTEVDVRVGAPNGALLATTGAAGSAATGKWVTDGMVFYLQNASYGDRTSPANTLATVTVGITTGGCAVSCASAGPDQAVVEYSAATHDLFAYGVQNAANVSFAVWGTAGGQNDLVWYPGQNLGNGTWKATVNFGNHPESGQFGAHVYMNDRGVWCDSADFTRTEPPLSDAVWVEDSLPAGATPYGTAEGWNWVGSNPPPYSGATAHMSNLVADVHQHYFEGAATRLWVNHGDNLYAYVYLDPHNTPSEIMLQWNDGTWEHRAYWGANLIGWGADGTNGRRYMGQLPAAGRWARLEVPAGAVGLEGRTLNGMAFTLYGGRAAWDRAGAGAESVPPAVNVALAANGATASSSSNYPYGIYTASSTIDGDRKGLNWGAGGGWNDGTPDAYPDWLQVDFDGAKTINEIDVFTCQDDYANPSEPTEAQTFSLYGLTHFEVQYWTGTAWANVGGGSVVDNNKVWRKFTFPAITTQKIRVLTGAGLASYSRLTEVEAYQAAQIGADPTGNNFSVARLDPANRTGQAGTDLFSGNYSWSTPLVSLRGRANLDLSVSLSYNSLVWTKDNAAIKYDADRGTPSAGFRLGFPVIESRFFNPQTNRNAYLMITPAGARVELRQVGSTNVYEAADSSYLQLVENGGTLTLRATDGTQLSYVRVGNTYRCTQVKDRNGNFISVSYYGHGGIHQITDTLGRVVTFNYDTNNRPISITQTSNGATHTWATFGYGNIFVQPPFSGLALYGPQNRTISVLTQVGLSNGTRYNFEYSPAGQVSVIRHKAADNHQLSYTAYDFDANTTNCPRVTARREYAEDWNNGAEALTTYADEGNGVRALTMPDRTTVYKEFFAMVGWRRGLSTRTETWNGGLQKWTTTDWTQDDERLAYQLNPRPFDSSIYDAAGNRRRTAIAYTNYGLPSDIREYAADGQSVLQRTHVDYKFDAVYLERRLIGLPAARFLYEGESTLLAKTDFHYDWGGEYFSAQTPSVQHDGLSYGAGFLTGRGNLSAVRRFNKDAPDDTNQAVWQQLSGYNAAGSPVFARDADGHTTQISYADDYAGGNNSRNTLSYPTKVTDADGFTSTVRYNYDRGVVTRTEGPPPEGHTHGVVTNTAYDNAGRVERVTNETSGAYTRYVYGADNKYVQSFSLLEAGVESYAIRVFDGAGRVRATAANHPGSAGGYSAQYIKYDVLGRAVERTNPAEITAAWQPAGDDALGWVWSKQAYDWQGRPTITTNTDRTTREASYGGCGCAGGQVVTLRDEVGRKQKVYADALGRVWKSEDLNRDGSVYRTMTTSYNALDQVTRRRIYQGAAPVPEPAGEASTYQTTRMTYDGHGRLATQKAPIQTKATVYAYNADDTLHSVTDGRGAVQTMGYNARHLVTGINYSAPSGIAATGGVAFDYDAAGNRRWMTDGLGRVDYVYNALSQLTSETRQFAGLSGSYTLSYQYTVGGALEKVTDPMGVAVDYGYDAAGRLSQVTGTPYGGVSQYATEMQYRAFGALKEASYGNGLKLHNGYNARLQLAQMQVGIPDAQNSAGRRVSGEYSYDADGQIKLAYDHTDESFNRVYSYDHVARLKEFRTDSQASSQSLTYDVWGNLTGSENVSWRFSASTGSEYLNNRTVRSITVPMVYPSHNPPRYSYWTYDDEGHVTRDHNKEYTYNAAGDKTRVFETTEAGTGLTKKLWIYQDYDANGQRAKRVEQTQINTGGFAFVTSYYVRSTALGGRVVTELDEHGRKRHSNVYASGAILAKQKDNQVHWIHTDPVTAARRETDAAGHTALRAEFDTLGNEVPVSDPQPPESTNYDYVGNYDGGGNPYDGASGCAVDGQQVPCYLVMRLYNHGKGAGLSGGGISGDSRVWVEEWEEEETIVDGGRAQAGANGSPEVAGVIRITARSIGHFTTIQAQPQNSTLVPKPDFRARLNNLLNDPICANFAHAVIYQAAADTNQPLESPTIMGVFDKLDKSGNVEFVEGGLPRGDNGHALGNFADKNAKMRIAGRTVSMSPLPPNATPANVRWATDDMNKRMNAVSIDYIKTVLGETMHLAGRKGFDDRRLAMAASDVTGIPGLPDPLPPGRTDTDNKWRDANSFYFHHTVLRSRCK